MMFPPTSVDVACTSLELQPDPGALPYVVGLRLWGSEFGATSGLPRLANGPGVRLLGEHAHELLTRPHLRGHRVGANSASAAWSTRFVSETPELSASALIIRATDQAAGLTLLAEFEAMAGGGLRGRYTITNDDASTYVVEGLEVVLPVADNLTEVLDFTGRHERERSPQRHPITDGLWLRESRGGRPGLGAATMVVLGTDAFSPTEGDVVAAHVAWSGNSVLRVERDTASGTTVGGGELLQPGEVCLKQGESYATPWVMFAAADDGLDGLAAVWHSYQRALPTHPGTQPVLLNVWEAVYFDHDLARLTEIAERAARVGVECFVLDDGWFRHRRDDTAGLGDWYVDEGVWPDGLAPLIDTVRSLGMDFGLWFEPEMVNPDSDLYRAHPDWILATGDRIPSTHRNQLVLDLTRPEVSAYLLERMSAILSAYPIDYVKWDHNRDLIDAGSGNRSGAPVAHDQTLAFYTLLDALRSAHPSVRWESCASGGGRIDLGVIERVQRVWTSDMTDALARQQIQPWTAQLVAPEYVGAHISSPTSHTTGRTLTLDFRAATALFGSFGIEWDLTEASEADLDSLADWIARYQRFRGLLHSGRVTRPASSDPAVRWHGVVAADGGEALIAHVQLDESSHNRGVWARIPGLVPTADYELRWEGPIMARAVSKSSPLAEHGPTGGVRLTGAALATAGFWMPRRRPETCTLVHLRRMGLD
jgi:alpha-galactosidase